MVMPEAPLQPKTLLNWAFESVMEVRMEGYLQQTVTNLDFINQIQFQILRLAICFFSSLWLSFHILDTWMSPKSDGTTWKVLRGDFSSGKAFGSTTTLGCGALRVPWQRVWKKKRRLTSTSLMMTTHQTRTPAMMLQNASACWRYVTMCW